MSRPNDQQEDKSKRLITFALFNAYGQWFITWYLFVTTILGGVSGPLPAPPIVDGNSSLSFFVVNNLGVLINVAPAFSFTLIPARHSKRWRFTASIAMLLNTGTMLILALTGGRGFFLPMIGYLVSAALVGLSLIDRKS